MQPQQPRTTDSLNCGSMTVPKSARSAASGGHDQFVTDEYPVAVSKSGLHVLCLQPRAANGVDGLIVRSVRLVPIESVVTP